jgi:hypothetical protein
MAEQVTTSQIDPAFKPYLTSGLERAQQLFLTGPQPTFFPGQTYVSPSEATTDALTKQETIARAESPSLQAAQQAYQLSLGQIGKTAAGEFLQGSPYQQAMVQAATRPLTQQFGEQVLPGISSLYSRAGRYGSGAMERALSGATEAYGRSLGDVTSNIVGQDYARERGLQQQAQMGQGALTQLAPSVYQQQFLPSQALAQVGAAREGIAAQPLQEQMARFSFGQQQPIQSLMSYLSSVYGTPLASYGQQTTQLPENKFMGGLAGAGLGYLGGSLFGGTPLNAPGAAAGLGALGGGLLGYFL